MTLALLPDVEAALIGYLRAQTDVQALKVSPQTSLNVSSEVEGPYPMLRVTRTGGPSRLRLDNALISVEAWNAPDVDLRHGLRTLARTALAALDQLPTQTLTGIAVSHVTHVVTLQFLPDPLTNQQRYLHHLIVHAHTKP